MAVYPHFTAILLPTAITLKFTFFKLISGKHGRFSLWNRWNHKNHIKLHCDSMQFQTGIRTASELHRCVVLFGIRTAGTAGIAVTAGIGTARRNCRNCMEPHDIAYFFNASTCKYLQFKCVFCNFCNFCSSRTAKNCWNR